MMWNALLLVLLLISSPWGREDNREAWGISHWGRGGIAATPLPTDISGLKIWLEADYGITKDGSDRVSQWVDKTGNITLAGTSTTRPIWVASVALANSQPGVQFDGLNDYMNGDMVDFTAPYTIILISTEPTNNGCFHTLYELTSHHGEVPYLMMGSEGNYRFLDNNVGWNIEGEPLASWMEICPSGAVKGYKNGDLEYEGTAITLDLIGLVLGACGEWLDNSNITIVGFLTYNHDLNIDEIAILNSYLIPKFGRGI